MDDVWSLPRRVAFRFGLIAGILYVWPFPLGLIPKTETLAEYASKPWQWLVLWFSESVLGTGTPATEMTGSGDTLFQWVSTLLIVILAAVGAAIWSAIDRKPRAYPRLADWSVVGLRYVLGIAMLAYGFAKVVPTQFQSPSAIRLDGTIGDMSPMGMLWTFMGASMPYTVFAGMGEVLGGVLLLIRRTATLGALVSAAVLTNVVVLNFCYDVPVKLYSSQLLLVAIIIASPHLRRILAAVLGYATPEVPAHTRGTPRAEKLRLGLKVVTLLMIAYATYEGVQAGLAYRGQPNALSGTWVVDTFELDGKPLAPLVTDGTRWRKLLVGNGPNASVRMMTDERQRFGLELDEAKHTAVVRVGAMPDTWRYSMVDAWHLTIEGTFNGKPVRVRLYREPPGLLVTRGFHWIQEAPFNR